MDLSDVCDHWTWCDITLKFPLLMLICCFLARVRSNTNWYVFISINFWSWYQITNQWSLFPSNQQPLGIATSGSSSIKIMGGDTFWRGGKTQNVLSFHHFVQHIALFFTSLEGDFSSLSRVASSPRATDNFLIFDNLQYTKHSVCLWLSNKKLFLIPVLTMFWYLIILLFVGFP